MVKTRAATTLAALAALALSGCEGSATSTDVKQDAKAPLEIWVRFTPGSPDEATAKALAAKFTETSGIQTTVTASADLETKLQQAAASKNLPDIVINDTAQLGNLVSQGLVQEVKRSDIADSGKLSAAWQAATASDGKYYGVPFNAQAYALLIRKDWREKVGQPEPKSWADLVSLAKAFTAEDPDGNGKADTYGFDVVGSTTRGYISWYFSSLLFSDGGDYLTGSGGKFTPAVASDNSVAALTWFQGLFCTDKVVLPGSVTQTSADARTAFNAGKAGIYLTGPYNMAPIDKVVGVGKVEAVPVPAGPNGGGKAASLVEGENIYLMAGSLNEAGQRKFAEFATSVEGQTIAMNGDKEGNIVRLPVNQDVKMSDVRTDTRWQVFADVYANNGKLAPQVPNWTPFRQASADTFNAIVSNCSADPKAELTKLADTFKQELQKQGVLR